MYIEFKEGQKFAATISDISDQHESFKDAGWVLNENDLVVDIDVLPKETIEKLIVYFNINTQIVWTDRGAHFYFKKPEGFKGAKRICPLGFEVEYKHIDNTKAVTIKRNGQLREIKNEGIREDLPDIFSVDSRYNDLLGMSNGEGRNTALFKHRAKVAKFIEWLKILSFINDYIFEEPLPLEEFQSITRDVQITAEKGNEYNIAGYLLNELDYLRYGGKYYFKETDEEYSDDEKLLRKKVYEMVGETTTRYVDEVIKQMQYRCREVPHETIFKIKFKNGYLYNGEFFDLITEDFSPYKINIDYNPAAEPVKVVDDYINLLTNDDEDYRNLLLEVLSHTLIVDPEFKRLLAKFFIFEGKGGNGKGTLLQIIKSILGSENVSGMSISELTDERYLSAFKGKLANLGDDLQDQAIDAKAMKILKNISTCDYISSRELYKNAEQMYFTGSLIFTSNHSIKSWEKGESYKRRVLWLPMFTKVKKKDPLFITKLTCEKAIEYWIKLIVEGYKRLYKQKVFTTSNVVIKHNEKYHMENNPAQEFLLDYEKKDIVEQPVKEIYDAYEEWCEDNGIKAKSTNKMIRETIEEVFQLESRAKRVNGKVTKCFMPIED